MSAQPDSILSHTATVDKKAVEAIPNSKKIYVTGSRADIRVPMREISCSPTQTQTGLEENTPITVYDTSGAYTDPEANIDIRKGLQPLRAGWIAERDDTVELD
ncbi:MAG: phosphomethylpyrimidine synthase ThiC, partial [Gammaproteobacteria bacterium]